MAAAASTDNAVVHHEIDLRATMDPLRFGKSFGRFIGVSRAADVPSPPRRAWRILLYAAIQSGGMIGPEFNGIAIVDAVTGDTLLENHFRVSSGYYGPPPAQSNEFSRLAALPLNELQDFLASFHRGADR